MTSDRVFDNSHCVMSLTWTSTDLPLISAICLGFIKTCRRVKNRAKMSEYLCSWHLLQALRESLRAWAQTCLRKQSRRAGLYTWNWTESAHEYSLLLSTGESLDYSLSGYRLGFREQHTHRYIRCVLHSSQSPASSDQCQRLVSDLQIHAQPAQYMLWLIPCVYPGTVSHFQ